ncbi:cytosolic carboxypeptidase 3 [Protopterus annectens]|uniref:cytosolic carboxypeptidase 3 n=1 Tax=Protopterus annectens TaxID=7888 RepID=UPI001CFBD8A5|nr:cytosolic carboxypeptidase 3 [Protopterus annectens]
MTGETEKAQHTDNSVSDDESDEEPYDEFMRRHLQQYGFCTDLLHDHCIPRSTQIVFEYHSGRRVPRLRKPRDLYGVSSSDSEQLSRWPFECEVLKEKIHHINWVPSVPEPLYKPTGLEKEPVCMDATYGTVVYEMDGANKEPYFICSRVGGCRGPLKRVAVNISDMEDTTLIFESRFESGNLQKAVKVGEYDYELTLRNDYYTNKHTQWYYFRVSNTRPDVTYRFTIINFLKPSSLYNLGMRPLMYSELEAHTRQVGWHRIGDEIKYYRNNLMQDGQQYYSLTWTFQFPHKNDTCYFAHCYPYTYRDLQDYLIRLANDPWKSQFCKIRVLCHSLAGNMVYVLTITNPSQSRDEAQHKKAVVLTARVHPGESNSSWIMKGFLDYILGNSADATVLRDAFIFKVVPMLNPDGVIVGNYRCSLTGRDLNRNYKTILKESFPSVWYTRNMVKLLLQEREVILYCDFHGHSRKQNVFVYGCGECLPSPLKHRAQVFPFMLSRNCQDKFSFSDCKFKVQKSKEGTGRVVMWKLGVSNSYTMEASFCGSVIGRRKGTHFSTEDFESLSYCLCDTLLDYCDPDRTKYIQCLKKVEEITKQHINLNTEIPEDNDTLPISDVSDAESRPMANFRINGSNSSESDGLPVHLLEMASKMKPRKKLLKTKKERDSFHMARLTSDNQKAVQDQGDEAGRPCGKKRASLRGHGDHILGENLGEKQMTQNQYDNGSAMQRLEYGRKNSLPISEEKQMICDRVPGKV